MLFDSVGAEISALPFLYWSVLRNARALMRFRRCRGENLDSWSDLCEDGRRVWVEVDVDKRRWDHG